MSMAPLMRAASISRFVGGRQGWISMPARASGLLLRRFPRYPAVVEFNVNATGFGIELKDAMGGIVHSQSGAHGLGPLDAYHFTILYTQGGIFYYNEAVIDSVTIIPEPSTYAAILGLLAMAGFLVYRRRR